MTGVDQDRDGFIDTSFTFFGNDSTAIGTDYHPYSLEFDVNMWVPVTLPATITQFGNYKITSPWTGSGIALEITADNVVVDGQNSLLSLTGSEDYPTVVIYDSSNVLLKNMNITQGAASIYVAESSHVTIRGTNLYENSIIGLYAFGCQNLTVQNCRIEWCQDFAGIYAVECTGIYIVKSILNHNAGDGITLDSVTHFTVANCTLNYNGWGMEAWQSNNGVVQNCLMSNNTQAVYSQELNNVTFCDNVFSYNGLSDGVYCGGFESAYGNCTVTGNLFEGNYDALMWRTRNNNDTSTMNVHSNVFLNNKYTFFFYSRQTSDSTSHKLLFYNNMVNDTAYVDPECFNSTYSWDYLPLSGVNLNLNTTLQSGARIYGSPSKVGGNFWAKPDGTGYSQTGTDSNRDGFIDAPFDLFNNATIGVVYDYLPYSQNYATSLAFTAGGAQTLAANQTSTLVTVRLQDAYGAITTGATVSLTSNFTTAKFYSDAAGTNQITSVTIPAGSSTASFYFKDTAAGNPTLVASSPSVIAASTQFTVNQHAATVQYITISPAAATVAAGTAVTYYTTAYDPYGNSWNVTSTYNVNGNDLSANTLTPIQAGTYLVEATYNDLAASTTLTATPAALDHFAVLVPSSVFVGTPFDIVVYALDAYRNVVTGYAGTASLSINKGAITPATPGDFIEGVWTGKVAVSETGQVAISASDSNGHKGQSVNFTVTSQPTPTPTPNPTSTIEVTTPNGGNINLAINGNITSSQISGATLTTNQTSSATTLSFTLTGQTGTTGFCNITIPKSQVLYGTTPTVYVDGQPAQNQGFSQDNQNYYVWYTTSFSTHQMQVVFSGQSTNGLDASLVWYALIIAVGIAVVALSFLVIRQKQKHAT